MNSKEILFIFMIGFISGFLALIGFKNQNDFLKVDINSCKCNTTLIEKIVNKNATISDCNKLYAATTDELSIYDPYFKNNIIKLYKEKELIVDDILFGYDILFENNARYASSSWLGSQFQQDPSDAILIQMLLWEIKPDLIIDLGTNTGGSALFFASIMNYYNPNGKVITIDVKSYEENWYKGDKICKICTNPDQNPLWKKYVKFYKGYTTEEKVLNEVRKHVNESKIVLVSQDASHYPNDVYKDLIEYSKFVSIGSYIIVQDTKLDRIVRRSDNSIHSKIDQFLKDNNNFLMNRTLENFFFYTQHAKGFLKRIK